MDLGDLTFISFTTFDGDLEIEACRTPLQTRNTLSHRLLQTKAKILLSQRVLRSLTDELRAAEVARARLGLHSTNIANHPVVVRLSTLMTTHHLMKRYQMVHLRDMMRMKHALRICSS